MTEYGRARSPLRAESRNHLPGGQGTDRPAIPICQRIFHTAGILAGKKEKPEVVANAIFSRFPNKNPENATLAKKWQRHRPPF